MQQYRTEVVIPSDGSLFLQLPDRFPTGKAIVTVWVHEPELSGQSPESELDDDHLDIEWWEEFDGDREEVAEPSS